MMKSRVAGLALLTLGASLGTAGAQVTCDAELKVAVIILQPAGSDYSLTQNNVVYPQDPEQWVRTIMFDDSNPPPVDLNAIPAGNATVKALWEESSFGQTCLDITDEDIYGPYPIGDPPCASVDENACDRLCWMGEGRIAAEAEGYVQAEYDRTMYVFPSQTACGGGLSGVAFNYHDIEIYRFHIPAGYAHELGHMQGSGVDPKLAHADDVDVDVPVPGLVSEGYRDLSCTMGGLVVGGNNLPQRHFHAYHKWRAGWLQATEIMTTTLGQRIAPAEIEPGGDPALLKLRYQNDVLWVSYRARLGIDDNPQLDTLLSNWGVDFLDKVSIHTVNGTTELEAVLGPPPAVSSFPYGSITVNFVAADATGATVDILMPCEALASLDPVHVVTDGTPGRFGPLGTFTLTVTNNGCGSGTDTFELTGTALPGDLILGVPASVSVPRGQSAAVSVIVRTQGEAPGEGVYDFSILASNAEVGSATAIGAFIVDTIPPQPPSILNQLGTYPPLTVNWNQGDGTGSDIVEDRVFINGVHEATVEYPADQLRYRDLDPPSCASLAFQVRTVDEAGLISAPSPTLTVVTPPDAPSGLADLTEPGGQPVELLWTGVADNGCGLEYVVQRDDVEIGRTASTQFSDATIPSCSAASYTYRVYAANSEDELSSGSNPVAVSVVTPPDAPTELTDSTGLSGYPVALTWTGAADHGCGIEYVVHRDGVEIARTTNAYYVDGAVSSCASDLHDYQVFAANSEDEMSAGSATVGVRIPYATKPGGVTVVSYNGYVGSSWSAPTSTCGAIADYEIERKPFPAGTPTTTFTTTGTTFSDTPTPNQYWQYRVRAVTSAGSGDFTGWKKVYVSAGG